MTKKDKEHPWLWGLFFALIFFVVIGVIGNLSEDPVSTGESLASWSFPLALGILGFYLGWKLIKRKDRR